MHTRGPATGETEDLTSLVPTVLLIRVARISSPRSRLVQLLLPLSSSQYSALARLLPAQGIPRAGLVQQSWHDWGSSGVDNVLVDRRSLSFLKDVHALATLPLSTNQNLFGRELPGHRTVVVTLRCRLQKSEAKTYPATHVLDQCMNKGIQSKIQDTLTDTANRNLMATAAVYQTGFVGVECDSRLDCPLLRIWPQASSGKP